MADVPTGPKMLLTCIGNPAAATYSMMIREPCAEFLGVALLIVLGAGVNCQVNLSSDSRVADSQKGVSIIPLHTCM